MTANRFWRAAGIASANGLAAPSRRNDDAIVGMAMDIGDLDWNRLERD
jgi:hypothetical protein